MKFWRVGGCNRDEILGIPTKDVDFAVEANSFEEMVKELTRQGFVLHVIKEEFLTVRAGVPKDHPLYKETKDADFVICRSDSETSDGRRPEFVEPGTILTDLARRDFTVNAIAKDPETGEWLDPHNGIDDIHTRTLRFVGNPLDRINEDGLRVMRAFRFCVVRGFTMESETLAAVSSFEAERALLSDSVSSERIREELNKMLKHDTVATLKFLHHFLPPFMLNVIFKNNLRLEATLKG